MRTKFPLARVGNLIAEAANDAVVDAGSPPYLDRAFTPKHPILLRSFISVYLDRFRSYPSLDGGSSRRPHAVYGIDMGRPVTDRQGVIDNLCSPADYYGAVLDCGDPLPIWSSDDCPPTIGTAWVPGHSSAEIHTMVVGEIEAVLAGLEAELCVSMEACGLGGCDNLEWLLDETSRLESTRFDGFRLRLAVSV